MRYATQYNCGRHPNSRKNKTKKAAQTGEGIHRMDATNKGCSGNKQRQEEVCACTNAANGFLKSTFLPKMEVMKALPSATVIKRRQRDVYGSLREIVRHYNDFEPNYIRMFDYPYNIALSVWEVTNYLKRHVRDLDSLKLIQDKNGKTFFTSREQYDTGTTLYYIPVIPLYKMIRARKKRKVARLLLSVFSYLYGVADIPYYKQEGTYIYWEHEMIAYWIEQDDESELTYHKKELEMAQWCGEIMEQKICNLYNLKVFAERIKTFVPENDFEKECMRVAMNIFSIYIDYPTTSVFVHAEYVPDDEKPEDEVIAMNKYISFVADNKGWLYETLAECVNNEFNEYGKIDEPAIVKTFNGTTNNKCNLDFENRLFPLIGDLCNLLNND